MLIFGTAGKVAAEREIHGKECPSCGQHTLIQRAVYRYLHVFWIPTLPYRKVKEVECTHCKALYEGKDEITKATQPLSAKPPISLFSGMVLIIAFIFFVQSSIKENHAKYAEYIQSPQQEDLLVMEYPKDDPNYLAGNRYGVLRVEIIEDGSVALVRANYAYRYWSDATKALRKGMYHQPEYFGNEQIISSKSRLQSLYEEGKIKAIIRDSKIAKAKASQSI